MGLVHASGELKKALTAYRKADLLILDEWLIRFLTPEESYDLLELVEVHYHHGLIQFSVRHLKTLSSTKPRIELKMGKTRLSSQIIASLRKYQPEDD